MHFWGRSREVILHCGPPVIRTIFSDEYSSFFCAKKLKGGRKSINVK